MIETEKPVSMATRKTQLQALFSQPAAWELFIIRRPHDPIRIALTFIDRPELCRAAVGCLNQLN